MTAVNELCSICNTSEDIEHRFLHCTAATCTSEHFLPLLNKVLPFKITKTVDLLPLFPVKVDCKSYLIKLILYQIWLARCSHHCDKKLILPHTIIKQIESELKQRITLCFQAHSSVSAKQMQIRRAKDALFSLDNNNQLVFKF